ncbi:putative glutathione S-transferase GSTF1 [Panicum miliaceum]|uniref:glutathione transferase n=1 Tax=Panicum miliaceum TaxID=4540 RepID=A0A3L6R4P9_PANMI|nr:putative glutathione S-transferase GSTF1 [Panicum miliaceum]
MSPAKMFRSAVFTNVAQVLVCLEEVGAEYEVIDVDFHAVEHKGPDHLARNSRAISRYVLRKYRTPDGGTNLLRDGDLQGSALVDAWLDVEAQQYEPTVHAVFVQHRVVSALGGTPDEKAIGESVEKLRKVLKVYDAWLGERRYLVGDTVSLADLSHFPCTHYFMGMPYAAVFDAFPRVRAWWEELVARPTVQKVAAMMDSRSGCRRQ